MRRTRLRGSRRDRPGRQGTRRKFTIDMRVDFMRQEIDI